MRNFVTALLTLASIGANAQLKVISNGNVGIGTVTPVSALHIKTPGTVTIQNTNNWQWAGTPIDFMSHNNITNGRLLFSNAEYPKSSFHLYVNTANGLKESFKVDFNGNAWLYGSISQYSTWMWSDGRFKENIVTSDNSLQKILNLRGVYYKAKDEIEIERLGIDGKSKKEKVSYGNSLPHKMQYGFVAQEVEAAIPNLVATDSSGFKSVNYVQVIPILVEALKELNAKNEELEAKLKKLESKTGKNLDGGRSGATAEEALATCVLYQNNPNPFGKETSIKYSLPESVSQAKILIYDMTGKQLKAINITTKGDGAVTVGATALGEGMYIYSLVADGTVVDTKRMLIIK